MQKMEQSASFFHAPMLYVLPSTFNVIRNHMKENTGVDHNPLLLAENGSGHLAQVCVIANITSQASSLFRSERSPRFGGLLPVSRMQSTQIACCVSLNLCDPVPI